MTDQEALCTMKPGEFGCDLNPHVYLMRGKRRRGFLWEAISRTTGKLHTGIAKSHAEAERKAELAAR